MSSRVEKARGERARIEQLLAREEARIRRAFRQFLDDVRDDVVRHQVRLALERGGIEAALPVIDSHILRLGGVLSQTFQAAGATEAAVLARAFRAVRPAIAISFDPSYPRAAEIMRTNRLEFVREFTQRQRAATRAALAESLMSGAGPAQTARAFRNSIGLTEFQERAVENYRAALERQDYAAALDRGLRDRRSDRLLERLQDEELLMEDREPLGGARIDRMVETYRNRYLQYRAETIARTEGQRAVSLARQEALEQAVEQLDIPRESVVRVWRATQDARTRDTHAEMDGQERGLEEPFESPSGALLMYPGDPDASIEEVANCRCVLLHEFRDQDEA